MLKMNQRKRSRIVEWAGMKVRMKCHADDRTCEFRGRERCCLKDGECKSKAPVHVECNGGYVREVTGKPKTNRLKTGFITDMRQTVVYCNFCNLVSYGELPVNEVVE